MKGLLGILLSATGVWVAIDPRWARGFLGAQLMAILLLGAGISLIAIAAEQPWRRRRRSTRALSEPAARVTAGVSASVRPYVTSRILRAVLGLVVLGVATAGLVFGWGGSAALVWTLGVLAGLVLVGEAAFPDRTV